MKKKQNNYIILIIIMILLIGIFTLFISESKCEIGCFGKNGILNLKNWDWTKNSIVEIDGEWNFYPNLFKEDLNAHTPSVVENVPHFWETDSNMKFSPYGFGTYKLKITGLKSKSIYGLEMPDEATAYTVFINNEKVASNGTVSKERRTYVPQWHPLTSVFQADENGDVEFIVEISNFDYHRGGFWKSIKIGTVNDILSDANKDKARDMFLFATIFIVGFFNLALFFMYKKDKTTLWFALFCFSMSIRIILTGQRLILDMTSIFGWNILVREDFLLGYVLLPIVGMFIMNLVEVKTCRIMMENFYKLFIISSFAATLIMPNYLYSCFLEPYNWLCILFGLYFTYLIVTSIKKRKVPTEFILLGILGIIVSILEELFNKTQVSWEPFASLNFVICFSIITFQQFLNIIKKNEVLEMKLILDPLTGLYNRTCLMELDEHYFDEHKNQNKYVMFLDLDRFKYINDTFGHKIGDYILQETGNRLKNILEPLDIICRYGGDEFIIIVTTNSLDEIVTIAEKIIQKIQQPFEKDGINYHISVSIGITESKGSIKSIASLIKSSDEAMYKAKANGRNQYVFSEKV